MIYYVNGHGYELSEEGKAKLIERKSDVFISKETLKLVDDFELDNVQAGQLLYALIEHEIYRGNPTVEDKFVNVVYRRALEDIEASNEKYIQRVVERQVAQRCQEWPD